LKRQRPEARSPGERLQKVLAQLGLGSRRQAETWITAGRILVNGQPAVLGQRVSAGDQIKLDGRPVRQRAAARAAVFLCHRSPGQALLPRPDSEESLADGLPRKAGRRYIAISPMPQPDGGLELLASDGAMAERLQRSMRRQPLEFHLRTRGELSELQLAALQAGQLDRGTLQISSVKAGGGEGSNRWYVIHALGASGNDLRQLCARIGITASRILRTHLGTLALDRSLPRGRHRELTEEELEALLSPPAPAVVPPAGAGP
jgi:23S rRNA pseudouridine2605 synthase